MGGFAAPALRRDTVNVLMLALHMLCERGKFFVRPLLPRPRRVGVLLGRIALSTRLNTVKTGVREPAPEGEPPTVLLAADFAPVTVPGASPFDVCEHLVDSVCVEQCSGPALSVTVSV